MSEPQADKIYVFDEKAHGQVLRENVELRAEINQLKERLFSADTVARTIQENGATTIKELRDALADALERITEEVKLLTAEQNAHGLTKRQLAAAEEALARQKERARTGRLHAMQTRTRLSEALAETERNLDVRNTQLALTEKARRELEKTLERGQFAIAQLTRDLDYQKHLASVATAGWKRSQEENDKLRRLVASTDEALAQVQQESAVLRNQWADAQAELGRVLQELQRALPPSTLPNISDLARLAAELIKQLRAEKAEAYEDRHHLLQAQAKAAYHLRNAAPEETACIATLDGLAFAAADRIAVLRKERDDERQNRIALQQEVNAAFHAFREAELMTGVRPVTISNLAGHARDRITELQDWLDQARHDFRRLDKQAGDRLRESAADNDALVEALRSLEWLEALQPADDDPDAQHCYICARKKEEGHADDCQVARALDGRAGAEMMRDLEKLRAENQRLQQNDQNNNVAYTILREAFPRPSQINSLIGLARAAVTKIENQDKAYYDLRSRIADLEGRLADENDFTEWLQGECDKAQDAHHRLRLKHAKASKLIARYKRDLEDALSLLRQAMKAQTTNPKPQGDKPMPTIQEVADQMDRETPSTLTATGEQRAQTDLEAEMKRRLDVILAEGREDAGRAPDGPQSPGNSPRINFQPESHPSPAPDAAERRTAPPYAPTAGPQQITPETAPAGSRLLLRKTRYPHNEIFEATVLEWAPNGKVVKMRYPNGWVNWDSGILQDAVIIDTLPKEEPSTLARLMAKRMLQHLMGDGAKRPQGNILTFVAEGRNKAEALDHAIRQLENLKRRAQEQEPSGATESASHGA